MLETMPNDDYSVRLRGNQGPSVYLASCICRPYFNILFVRFMLHFEYRVTERSKLKSPLQIIPNEINGLIARPISKHTLMLTGVGKVKNDKPIDGWEIPGWSDDWWRCNWLCIYGG